MKPDQLYLILDIETTGLSIGEDSILEIGLVVDGPSLYDRPLSRCPRHRYVCVDQQVYGNLNALAMHGRSGLLTECAVSKARDLVAKTKCGVLVPTLYFQSSPMHDIAEFIKSAYLFPADGIFKVSVAGKNVAGFDLPFMHESYGIARSGSRYIFRGETDFSVMINSRTFDPGILYYNPRTDVQAPSLAECLDIAKQESQAAHQLIHDMGVTTHAHTAMADCYGVAIALRHKFGGNLSNEGIMV